MAWSMEAFTFEISSMMTKESLSIWSALEIRAHLVAERGGIFESPSFLTGMDSMEQRVPPSMLTAAIPL